MSLEPNLKVAENSKILAKKYLQEENFGRAFSHYLVALKLKPDWKVTLKEEFSTSLCKLGAFLHDQKRFSDLFHCYEQAIEVFPENEINLNNLGAHLLRCGLIKEAAHYFRESLRVRPHFIRAAHNLENVSNLAVERWHFRMLNDIHRNEAYREAVIKKINQGYDRVLDIGTGTGILSLFSIEGGAREIYSCDSSSVMTEIARQVFHQNHATRINLINKHSSDLKIPEDLPRRVSLVVTETLDAGLLGEGILTTLSEAWKNLLSPDFSFVIPYMATIYLTGIQCDKISKESYVTQKIFNIDVENIGKNTENYDTIDLKRVPFKYLTNVEKILKINFNDPKCIEEVLRGECDANLQIKCKESGRLDCFAVWFDLSLDEDITLNTGPESKSNEAWDQAIFFLPKCRTVQPDDDISVKVSFKGGRLRVLCGECREFEPSEDVIRTLNDSQLLRVLSQVQSKLVNVPTSMRVLDLFSFPVFGLNFLIAREKKFEDKLTCAVSSKKDKDLVNFVVKEYNLQDKVTVLTDVCFENLAKEEKFDVILMNLVETTGEINDGFYSQGEQFKSLLKPKGIFLPEEVKVMGQLIHSDWLLKASRVIDDEKTCEHKIAEFINLYEVRHFIDINMSALNHTVWSDPVELFEFFTPETIIPLNVSRSSFLSLPPNALVYWFKIKLMKDCDQLLTKEESSLYHQAAFLLPKVGNLSPCKLLVIRDNGLFSIDKGHENDGLLKSKEDQEV